jgi:hypothetical protein
MKVRLNLSWLIVGLLLLAPAAHGEETALETTTAAEAAVTDSSGNGGELQQKVVDEDKEDVNEPKATKTDVESVHAEVETLRDQWQRSLDRAFPTTVVQSNRPLIISGTGQFRFAQNSPFFHDDPLPANTFNAFSVPFFSINFAGNLRKDYLEGKNVDYQLGIQTTGLSAVSITDAWLSYQIVNSLDKEGPRLSITAGQQKKNFGNEATATEAYKPTIAGAQFATKLSLDQRDIGLVLAGDLFPANDYGYNYRVPLIQYWLSAINGSGPNTLELNNEKDLLARIQINAPVYYDHILRGLSLGLSGYKGWNNSAATNTTTNTSTFNTNTTPAINTTITTSTTTATITKKGAKERWGADLAYVNTPIGFTLEYVRGKDLAVTNGSVTTKNGVATKTTPYGFNQVDEEGYTFTLFYNFGDQFVNAAKQQDRYDDYYPLTYQPFVRFDRWTPNTDFQGIRTDIWTVGFNWFFAQTTKLQLNYNITRNYSGGGLASNTDAFLAQFQFGF